MSEDGWEIEAYAMGVEKSRVVKKKKNNCNIDPWLIIAIRKDRDKMKLVDLYSKYCDIPKGTIKDIVNFVIHGDLEWDLGLNYDYDYLK